MKVISKSLFKLGLVCPNKLFYTANKSYANNKKDDTFLMALASGGFQIEEYARMHFLGGILIDGDYKNKSYKDFADETTELLKQENIIIYEAAFLFEDLFIRADILIKKGNRIELIEVKSKSYDPNNKYTFVGKKGGIVKSWKPYLFDISFQKYVVQQCMPNAIVKPYLFLVDKTKKASVDGLNQLFRVTKNGDDRTGIEKSVDNISQMGESLLIKIEMDDIVTAILSDKYKYYENLGFKDAINLFPTLYKNNTYPNWPTAYSKCKSCEFKATNEQLGEGMKSGFKNCFEKQHKWTKVEFNKSNIFNIWDFRGKDAFNKGLFFKEQLSQEDIKYNELAGKLSRTERQWMQIEKEHTSDFTEYIDTANLKEEMNSWVFPLHFIDFETSTVALPFYKDRKPYEQIAFQFSHHIYHEDGTIEHANEYIKAVPGVFPNFEFIEQLEKALMNDEGTIFKFASHENSIVNAIHEQLRASSHPRKEELIKFIETISHSKKDSVLKWKGKRDMIDLCKVVKDYYYNPYTYGSNSIKSVLPAVLKSSSFVRRKYSKPLRSINVSSNNFSKEHSWLKEEAGEVVNPYKILPKVYNDLDHDEIENMLSDIDNLDNGGAALIAFGKIQYTNMTVKERELIIKSLLKYCELDTLAMVMIYEHLKDSVS
jgi:hypothetical protein